MTEYLLEFLKNPAVWITAVCTVLGVVLGANAIRRRHVANGIFHGYYAVEDYVAVQKANGLDVPSGVEKLRMALQKADEWMRSNNWRPLKEGEAERGKLHIAAIHGANKVEDRRAELGAAGAPSPSPI
jgi:hypothetical protein